MTSQNVLHEGKGISSCAKSWASKAWTRSLGFGHSGEAAAWQDVGKGEKGGRGDERRVDEGVMMRE